MPGAIYREQIGSLADAPYVRGFFPWLLYDYRSERRQTRYQRGFSRKGLIAEDKRTPSSPSPCSLRITQSRRRRIVPREMRSPSTRLGLADHVPLQPPSHPPADPAW